VLALRAPAPAPAAPGPPGRSETAGSAAAARGAPPPGRKPPVSHSWLGALFMARMGASGLSCERSRGRLPTPHTRPSCSALSQVIWVPLTDRKYKIVWSLTTRTCTFVARGGQCWQPNALRQETIGCLRRGYLVIHFREAGVKQRAMVAKDALWQGGTVHGGPSPAAVVAVGHGRHSLPLQLHARVLVNVLNLLGTLHLPPCHPVVRSQVDDVLWCTPNVSNCPCSQTAACTAFRLLGEQLMCGSCAFYVCTLLHFAQIARVTPAP
jgi:hypothetical protein